MSLARGYCGKRVFPTVREYYGGFSSEKSHCLIPVKKRFQRPIVDLKIDVTQYGIFYRLINP